MDTAVSTQTELAAGLPTTRRPAVLIIGHGTDWRQRLEDRLQRAGCDVMTASNANQGIDQAVAIGPDVVMLGFDLPDTDSLEVCRRIRNRMKPKHPPAFLLAPTSGQEPAESSPDCVAERNSGPVWRLDPGIEILLASRGLPVLAAGEADRNLVRVGPLSLNAGRHHAVLDGRDLALTPTEFRLLWALTQNPGHVLDRDQLSKLCRIRGRSGQKRTVDVHVKSIRRKLRERAEWIETVYGVGYRFRDAESVVQ